MLRDGWMTNKRLVFLLCLAVIGLIISPVSAICSPGYTACNGQCLACRTGTVLGSDCRCHLACGDTNHYCSSGQCCNGRCVNCPSGSILGSDCSCHKPCESSSTFCASGSCCNDQCVSCSSGQILGQDCLCHKECGDSGYCRSGSSCLNGECVSCREGYYLGIDGSCHSIQDAADRKSALSTSSNELITRSYHWYYKGTRYSWKLTIPESLYDYYKDQSHDRSKSYADYAISSQDKPYLDAIIKKLKESGKEKGYSESDNVMNIIAFVQSFPYFKDSSSTLYDDYPRYPIETLVDNGGDCEDTAILTAAFLKEMGYGVILVNPPKHMAVGVKCKSCSGTYYTYQGEKYYYLETTGNDFQIGEISNEYTNTQVKIIPLD